MVVCARAKYFNCNTVFGTARPGANERLFNGKHKQHNEFVTHRFLFRPKERIDDPHTVSTAVRRTS